MAVLEPCRSRAPTGIAQYIIVVCRDAHVVYLENHRAWTAHGKTRVPVLSVRLHTLKSQLGHGIEREDIRGLVRHDTLDVHGEKRVL